jgi:hypothetical protein
MAAIILICIILFLVACGSTWLAYAISQTRLPTSDKVGFTAISAVLWAAWLGYLKFVYRNSPPGELSRGGIPLCSRSLC